MALVSAIVDSREPLYIRQLTFSDVERTVAELPTGDLWGVCDDGELIVVERKTPGDFLNTLRQDRLFPQLAQLREQSVWSYLVITGTLLPGANDTCWADQIETGWQWSAIQGALLTAQEIGVHVIHCNGDQSYEAAVLCLANRSRSVVRVTPARDTTWLTEAEAIVAALPGIGYDRAQSLIKECGTAGWALSFLADHDSQQHVPGIGPAIKRRIRRALGLTEEQLLAVNRIGGSDGDTT